MRPNPTVLVATLTVLVVVATGTAIFAAVRWFSRPQVVAAGRATNSGAATGTGANSGTGASPGTGGGTAPVVVDLTRTATVYASATAPDAVDDAGSPVSYPARNMVDGDPATAWRTPGDGAGVTITITMPSAVRVRAIGLIPGYAKIDPSSGVDRFAQNRRVAAVRWRFDDRTVTEQSFGDRPDLQRMNVTATTTTIVLEIVTTRPGSPDFDYTAISELTVAGYA